MTDAFQQRRARDERLRVAAPVDQLLGILEKEIRERASIQQRPQHAEQHPIDVPVRHGREETSPAEGGAPQRLEHRELCLDVADLSSHFLWYARRAGRVEHELRRRRDFFDALLRLGQLAPRRSALVPSSATPWARSRRRTRSPARLRAASGVQVPASCRAAQQPNIAAANSKGRSRFKTQRRPALSASWSCTREAAVTSSGQRCSVPSRSKHATWSVSATSAAASAVDEVICARLA